MAKRSPSQVKDALLHYVSQDIKNLQSLQCDVSMHEDGITSNNFRAQSLCEHMDCILLHGLFRTDNGYWPCVMHFTRRDAVRTLNSLTEVTTNIGRGRSWLNMALNEQVMESYLRTFIDNVDTTRQFYSQEAFVRDRERLSVLITLVSGLDFVTFDLDLDKHYLNFRATCTPQKQLENSSETDYDIKPTFRSVVTPEMRKREQLVHSSDYYLTNNNQGLHNKGTNDSTDHDKDPLVSSLPTSLIKHRTYYDKEREEDERTTEEEKREREIYDRKGIEEEVMKDLNFSKPKIDQNTSSLTITSSISETPSFLNRFKQLNEQEKELVGKEKEKEEFIVSRQRKIKKKKKKKKKDSEETSTAISDLTTPANESSLATPTIASLTTPTIVTAHNSIKENQPPTHSVEVIKFNDGEKNQQGDEETDSAIPDLHELVKNNELLQGTKKEEEKEEGERKEEKSTNPFDEDETNSYQTLLHENHVTSEKSNDSHDTLIAKSHEDHMTLNGTHVSSNTSHDSHVTSDESHVTFSPESQVSRERSNALSSIDNLLTTSEISDSTMTTPNTDTPLNLSETSPSSDESHRYDAPPTRPTHITDASKRECDLTFDNNTRVILSLDVYYNTGEELKRLVLVQIPAGPGRYQTVILTITNEAIYLIERDGTEGNYSRMMGIRYKVLDHIVSGLSWQSLGLVYKGEDGELKKQMLITGNEAVSRSIAETIRTTAVTIPLNRDDESRIEAIERELIKLGSETSMEVLRYCLVHWEQLSGETPLFSPPADIGAPLSGYLQVKESYILKMSSWKPAYFSLIDGTLLQFNSEEEKFPRAAYSLQGTRLGGCTRIHGEAKEYAFKVVDNSGVSILLAAKDEDELSTWMQALCMSAIGESISLSTPYSPTLHKGGSFCAVLLTNNKVHVLHEDWSNESVHLISSISVEDINNISVDSQLPVYCTLSYDNWENESPGVWMLCFSSSYELGQFEATLSECYKEIFQIEPGFSEVSEPAVKLRAEQALELMKATRERSDSLTKGRTEYTYTI